MRGGGKNDSGSGWKSDQGKGAAALGPLTAEGGSRCEKKRGLPALVAVNEKYCMVRWTRTCREKLHKNVKGESKLSVLQDVPSGGKSEEKEKQKRGERERSGKIENVRTEAPQVKRSKSALRRESGTIVRGAEVEREPKGG